MLYASGMKPGHLTCIYLREGSSILPSHPCLYWAKGLSLEGIGPLFLRIGTGVEGSILSLYSGGDGRKISLNLSCVAQVQHQCAWLGTPLGG